MGRLLLVRHGESIWNEAAIVQGQDGPGLSERGHAQARHVGDWLAQEAPEAPKPTAEHKALGIWVGEWAGKGEK